MHIFQKTGRRNGECLPKCWTRWKEVTFVQSKASFTNNTSTWVKYSIFIKCLFAEFIFPILISAFVKNAFFYLDVVPSCFVLFLCSACCCCFFFLFLCLWKTMLKICSFFAFPSIYFFAFFHFFAVDAFSLRTCLGGGLYLYLVLNCYLIFSAFFVVFSRFMLDFFIRCS